MNKKYFIKTFGCQMNKAESERIAGVFEEQGYQMAKKITEADMVVINTCSVRESAENRVFGLINNLAKKRRKKQRIILTGCMVSSGTGERRRYPLKRLKIKLPQVDEFIEIEKLTRQAPPARSAGGFARRHSPTHAFVPIMKGCNQFCTYCVVPYSRGKEKSRPFKEIVCEVEKLARKGYQHITLLGQNVNSYQPSFAKLLQRLHSIKGIKKISFITSNPWDLSDEIIETMKMSKIDRYLHLPVQSGDNEILRKMNRPYTAEEYLGLVEKIRQEIPDIKIGTDIIVGFPGETRRAFENTVKLCKKIGF
jgi:tRNA-2-methylthio-N6-dimethylallyladenosine synthase